MVAAGLPGATDDESDSIGGSSGSGSGNNAAGAAGSLRAGYTAAAAAAAGCSSSSSSASLLASGGSKSSRGPAVGPDGVAGGSAGAPVGGAMFNLVKNIIGSGILALPAGVAAFSGARGAMVPAAAMTVALGALSGYCFSLIGRACAATGAKTYGEAWSRTVGAGTAWLPSGSCTAKTFFACLSYSIIIGDSFSDIARAFGAPAWLAWRPAALATVSGGALLPLCLLKDLRPLSYTSLLGIVGTLYTAAVMTLRYFDGSYAPGGIYHGEMVAAAAAKLAAAGGGAAGVAGSAGVAAMASLAAGVPSFGGSAALNPLALVLASTLSTAFIAHYNAPKFLAELKPRGVAAFNKVVGASFGLSIALFVAMTAFPFLTFGRACRGYILNNYSTADGLATLCRLAIGLSILFGYPLTFITAREGVLAAAGAEKPSDRTVRLSTVGLLTLFTGVAVVLRDLGFVVSFGGAVLGSLIIYVFPAAMWVAKCRKEIAAGAPPRGLRRAEYLANYGIVALGLVLGVLGAVVSVLKTFVW
ncbi:unnamed protein product [Phaeothamnion confervicola]